MENIDVVGESSDKGVFYTAISAKAVPPAATTLVSPPVAARHPTVALSRRSKRGARSAPPPAAATTLTPGSEAPGAGILICTIDLFFASVPPRSATSHLLAVSACQNRQAAAEGRRQASRGTFGHIQVRSKIFFENPMIACKSRLKPLLSSSEPNPLQPERLHCSVGGSFDAVRSHGNGINQ